MILVDREGARGGDGGEASSGGGLNVTARGANVRCVTCRAGNALCIYVEYCVTYRGPAKCV